MKHKKLFLILLTSLLTSCSGITAVMPPVGNKDDNSEGSVINVNSISLSKTTLELKENETHTLLANIYPSNASNKSVTWSSSDEEVLSISNTGVITALKEGSATITVTSIDGNKQATCVVTVTKNSEGTNEVIIGQSAAKLKNSDEYNLFWANSSNVKVTLRFEEEAFNYIDQYDEGTTKDYYFPCDVTINVNGEEVTINEVGARRKGNMSISDNFNNGKIHYKLSFKETFDDPWYQTNAPKYFKSWTEDDPDYKVRDKRTYLDMEKIDFKWNRNYDATYLRQSYTNYIYREAGLIAPNNNIVSFKVYKGEQLMVDEVYDALENVDKVLIQRYFSKDSAKGDLYKCGWGNYNHNASMTLDALKYQNDSYDIDPIVVGIEDVTTNYDPAYDLKTNKKTSTHQDLINFISIINNDNRSGADFQETFESLVDLNYNAKVFAYSYAVGDPDDFRGNYNNLYMYFEPTTHKLYLIPYDHDRSLGVTRGGVGDVMPRAWFTSSKAYGYANNESQRNPFIWRTCIPVENGLKDAVPSSVNACKKYINEIKTGELFKPESFDRYVENNPRALQNSSFTGYDNVSYQTYYQKLIEQINNDARLNSYNK